MDTRTSEVLKAGQELSRLFSMTVDAIMKKIPADLRNSNDCLSFAESNGSRWKRSSWLRGSMVVLAVLFFVVYYQAGSVRRISMNEKRQTDVHVAMKDGERNLEPGRVGRPDRPPTYLTLANPSTTTSTPSSPLGPRTIPSQALSSPSDSAESGYPKGQDSTSNQMNNEGRSFQLSKSGYPNAPAVPTTTMHPEPHSVEKRGGDAHAPNMSISQNVPSSLLPIRDRVITFCHIGKAGGMTLRRATSLTCRLAKQQNDTPLKVQQCINRTFQPNHVLARSTQYYFHMWDVNTIELANSTSFLMALRNPVDRAISSFKFSHPGNCKREQDYDIAKRPWGCQVKMYMKKPDEVQRWMYQVCFPSAGMEEFAQNVLGPYPKNNPSHHFVHSNMTHEVQQQCRWIARQYLRGQWRQGAGPHMLYNYEYYRNTTIGKFPDKEVLGVRMEHEWEDIKALDVAMGGSGEYRHREGIHERHGSETFEASPLTTEAYHKLCCVLEREIGVYRDILDLVVNLNATAKQETLDDVQQKCGIETSWEDWGRNCRERMATDQAGLDESVNQRGIPMK